MNTKKTFGHTYINVAGVTFDNHQGALWNLRKHENGAYLTLRREKTNEKDACAIQVIAHCKDTKPAKIGYVPRKTALWLSKLMDEKKIVRCGHRRENGIPVPFVTGSGRDGYNLGCTLSIAYELR